jgi:hypothetical protein
VSFILLQLLGLAAILLGMLLEKLFLFYLVNSRVQNVGNGIFNLRFKHNLSDCARPSHRKLSIRRLTSPSESIWRPFWLLTSRPIGSRVIPLLGPNLFGVESWTETKIYKPCFLLHPVYHKSINSNQRWLLVIWGIPDMRFRAVWVQNRFSFIFAKTIHLQQVNWLEFEFTYGHGYSWHNNSLSS